MISRHQNAVIVALELPVNSHSSAGIRCRNRRFEVKSADQGGAAR
jgi:hypothetical protein